MPREIIEMSCTAGHQKTRRHSIGVFGPLIVVRTPTSLMDEACQFRTIPVLFQFEEAGIVRRQQTAFHAAQPSGKRLDRDANERRSGERIDYVTVAEWRHSQRFHLRAENASHVRE
ncbi:hypothetical protein FHX05_005265 [Rhizobium sp. BK491]|nr:hypothetical protein [Rhizobium sp. BK491]